MIFTSGENVSPHFEQGVKGDKFNVFNDNPYFVTFHLKALQTITRMMTLRRGFYDIPFQNVGLS